MAAILTTWSNFAEIDIIFNADQKAKTSVAHDGST
jgi:hypothetical protein